jgi:hypothetical protein
MKCHLALAVAAALWGQTALATEVFASKPKTVVTSIQALGYTATIIREDDGPRIDSTIAKLNYSIFFYGCSDSGDDCQVLEFNSSFTPDRPATPDDIANWNRDNLFGTAYLTDEGVASISYTVTTAGGLTTENFADVIARWEITLDSFATAIGY